jgi:hypothetical protein
MRDRQRRQTPQERSFRVGSDHALPERLLRNRLHYCQSVFDTMIQLIDHELQMRFGLLARRYVHEQRADPLFFRQREREPLEVPAQ